VMIGLLPVSVKRAASDPNNVTMSKGANIGAPFGNHAFQQVALDLHAVSVVDHEGRWCLQ
jgi:hypothetical protein